MECFIGTQAPIFQMTAVTGDGETFQEISLSTYQGCWLILFFYPMDFTFVCPTELTSFSKEADQFKKADAEILAVSTDSEYCHQAWIRNGLGPLSFPLASDKTMRTSLSYGVLSTETGTAYRGLFIIDPKQIIRYSVIHDNDIGRSTEEIYRVLKALQTRSLCGANWTVGSQPLRPAVPASSVPSDTTAAVTIYTQPDCSYCKKVKEFLQENHISYKEINLETDSEGQLFMESHGYQALPVTVIGSIAISGLQMTKIQETLLSQSLLIS